MRTSYPSLESRHDCFIFLTPKPLQSLSNFALTLSSRTFNSPASRSSGQGRNPEAAAEAARVVAARDGGATEESSHLARPSATNNLAMSVPFGPRLILTSLSDTPVWI